VKCGYLFFLKISIIFSYLLLAFFRTSRTNTQVEVFFRERQIKTKVGNIQVCKQFLKPP
jgi:hypothetical protein